MLIKEKEFKKRENSSGELTLTVDKESVNEEYQGLVKKYCASLEIKGFRKGKVPPSILETKFKEPLVKETIEQLIQNALKEVLDQLEESQRPISVSTPQVEGEPELNVGDDFTFQLTYDVFPEVQIGPSEDISIEEPQVSVSEKEIDDELKSIQERNGVVEEKENGKVEKDDIVTVDFCELNEDDTPKEETKREDFTFTVGDEKNHYKIDDEILGMKVSEERVFEKSLTEGEEERTTKLKVKLTLLKVRILPDIDDELAQDVSEKFKTLADLKSDITERLSRDISDRVYNHKREQILAALEKSSTIDVPESMIEYEVISRLEKNLRSYGMDPAPFLKKIQSGDGELKGLLESERPSVEKGLRESLIIREYEKGQELEVKEEEIDLYLKEERGVEEEKVAEFKEEIGKEYLNDMLKERKLFDSLFEKNKVKKKKMSYEELKALSEVSQPE